MNRIAPFKYEKPGVVIRWRTGSAKEKSTTDLIGEALPNFAFETADAQQKTPADFKGKKIVYVAWASWCPDCQQELPILNTLKEKYADKVEFVGVAMISQKEPIENGKKYLKEHSLSLNYYADVDSSFQKYHEITEIPTLIFVDKDGNIVKKTAGVLTQEELETYIKEIL